MAKAQSPAKWQGSDTLLKLGKCASADWVHHQNCQISGDSVQLTHVAFYGLLAIAAVTLLVVPWGITICSTARRASSRASSSSSLPF